MNQPAQPGSAVSDLPGPYSHVLSPLTVRVLIDTDLQRVVVQELEVALAERDDAKPGETARMAPCASKQVPGA